MNHGPISSLACTLLQSGVLALVGVLLPFGWTPPLQGPSHSEELRRPSCRASPRGKDRSSGSFAYNLHGARALDAS